MTQQTLAAKWQTILVEAGAPPEIYPPGKAEDLVAAVTTALVAWLATEDGASCLRACAEDVAGQDDTLEWIPYSEVISEVLALARVPVTMTCQVSEIAWEFFCWLASAEG